MENYFFSKLNEFIEYQGSGFGPGINNLILYGPIDKRFISNGNLDILKDREQVIVNAYEKSIIPKIRPILDTLTPNNVKIPNKKRLSDLIKIKAFEEVRKKVSSTYNGQFEMDYETLRGLFSDNPLNENKYVKFGFIGDEYMISYRKKYPTMLKKKYDNLYKYVILSNEKYSFNKDDFNNFLLDIIGASYNYWDDYSDYDGIYSKLNEFMVGDDLGLKIVDLNQERADKRMDELASITGDLRIPGFNVIKKRFDDHRKRVDDLRPGGLHYTLTDVGLNNFPIEVQYQGSRSFIYDKFGPNAHELYTFRNKKVGLK